jgi:tripartite-type tricarboxylate transporter receptor subunit TctC
LLLATLMLCQAAVVAQAQEWPPKTVRIVVPFAPGSTPDLVGRLLADSFQARHPGSSFVVENKPGASGNPRREAATGRRDPRGEDPDRIALGYGSEK